MKKYLVQALTIILLLSTYTQIPLATPINSAIPLNPLNNIESERNTIEDLILISNNHPNYGLIGSTIACWYSPPNTTGLKPLLIHEKGILQENQQRFITQYLNPNAKILALGTPCPTSYPTTTITGDPTETSLATALHTFQTTSHILILPATLESYTKNLHATPIASYLNIPLIFYDNNTNEILQLCQQLNVTTAIITDTQIPQIPGITQQTLPTIEDIKNFQLNQLKFLFNSINYLTITNPSDIILPTIISTNKTTHITQIQSKQLTILGNTINLQGKQKHHYNITIPSGPQQIDITTTSQPTNLIWKKLFPDQPIIFLKLYDPQQQLVAYTSSQANSPHQASIQTLSNNLSGNYNLQLQFYHGFKGGYFSLRGLSNVNTKIEIVTKITTYQQPYIPTITNLSQLAPYLTAAHGGILIANTNFSLIDESYQQIAEGTAAGPWYTETQHNHTNTKVNTILSHLNNTLLLMENNGLLDSYLQGPAWLALLGDTQMIPQYYYQPSQPGIPEKGLPSDNPYSLNNNLSVGRIMSWDIQDAAVLLARTFFYEIICGQPTEQESWHNRFSFIFGEGFGETGGIFHQIPYARKLKQYDFDARVYGDLRNSRQLAIMLETYVGANYIEYLGHGDWFWFTPSLYGLDFYSKAIDVAHVLNWVFEKPSVFLSSACLMGRVDGIVPTSAIGLTFLHAGCNAFIGATRETGSEAGLETMEDLLIIDNFSIGEALRGEKQVDRELPTYYVRVLFGDPAFNPYEPLNGFSNQGTPILH